MKRLTLALLLLAACARDFPATSEALRAPSVTDGGSSAASLVPGAPRSDGPPPAVTSAGPTQTAAPHPTGGIGTAASYCKPEWCETPRPAGISGEATWWFSFGHGLYAALRPDLGAKGDLAIVCGGEPFHCLSLPVTTTCACLGPGSRRLIDLSRDAFESFADPSVGTIRVSLQIVKGGAP